jgi:transposase
MGTQRRGGASPYDHSGDRRLKRYRVIAAIGQTESFARGRDLAAWLGLVPRQITTGGKPRLVGISERGNKYLRKLLIHGARAALPTLLESGATDAMKKMITKSKLQELLLFKPPIPEQRHFAGESPNGHA